MHHNPSTSRPLASVTDLGLWYPSNADDPDTCESVARSDDLVYEIDARGRLIRVSTAWNRFAVRNGAPELRAENVIGRRFWRFFDDVDGLVEQHRQLLDRCRRRDQRGTFLLRCDAPGERRMLRMWVEPLPNGGFRFTGRTAAVEGLDPVLYDHLLRVSKPIHFARCSECERFRVDEDWFEPEFAARQDWERDRHGGQRTVVHTLCPSCRADLRAVPHLVAAS